MDEQLLQAAVTEAAERLAVPGVTVGVFHDGVGTLFQFGSTGKTYTARRRGCGWRCCRTTDR